MAAELKLGHARRAASMFAAAYGWDSFPQTAHSLGWITATVGREATASLISAFAHYPCFGCTKGREKCEECGGTGRLADGSVCENCLGLGRARCGFCGGSGWVTLDFVPDVLKTPVIEQRVRIAVARLANLLAEPSPEVAGDRPQQAFRACAKLVVRLDRQLAVFDNALPMIKEIARAHPELREQLAKLARHCVRAARGAGIRVRQLLKRMAAAARMDVDNVPRAPLARQRSAKRAQFYEALADTNVLSESGLRHAHLEAVLKKAWKDRPKNEESPSNAAAWLDQPGIPKEQPVVCGGQTSFHGLCRRLSRFAFGAVRRRPVGGRRMKNLKLLESKIDGRCRMQWHDT